MIHLVKPMPVMEQKQGWTILQRNAPSLSIPAIPVALSGRDCPRELSISPQPFPYMSPQAVEAELVRRNNVRDIAAAQVPVPILTSSVQSSIVKQKQVRSGYRPLHLCYEPSSVHSRVAAQDQSFEEKLWRWIWIISLVCAAIAAMVFLVLGYNQL